MATRKRNWLTTAPEKEAKAKHEYARAYAAHRAEGGAPPRVPPVVLRNSKTKKWTVWKEINPADKTPAQLVPAVNDVARAMTSVEHGKKRDAGRQASEKVKAGDAKYHAIVAAIVAAGDDDLLRPPLRRAAIQTALSKLPKLKPPSAETFIRQWRRNN